MSMDEFFQSMKDNLEQRPEPDFNPVAWQRMEQQLAAQGNSKKGGAAWWWAGALGLLLIGSLIANWWQWQLDQQAPKPYASQQLQLQTDTIIKQQIIYQRDTIYQSRIIKEIVYQKAPATRAFTNGMTAATLARLHDQFNSDAAPSITYITNYTNDQSSGLQPSAQQVYTKHWFQQKLVESAPSKANSTTIHIPTAWKKLAIPMHFATAPELELSYTTFSIDHQKEQRKSIAQRLNSLRPQAFRLGALAGPAYALSLENVNSDGLAIGLEGQVRFAQQWQLWISLAYQYLNLQSDIWSPDLGIPNQDAPLDGYALHEVNYTIPSLQYSFGIAYMLLSRGNWHPLVGIGFGGSKQLDFEAKYEFKEISGDLEIEVENNIDKSAWQHGQLLLRGGLVADINKHWSWRLLAQWQKHTAANSPLHPSTISLLGGINYEF